MQKIFLTEYLYTLGGARYGADRIIAASLEEAEAIAKVRGVRVIGEFIQEIPWESGTLKE